MTIQRPDYSVFIPFDTWKLDDAIEIVFSESRYKREAEASSPLDSSELKKLDQAITELLKVNAYKYSDDVKYEDLYLDGNDAPETDDDCEIIQTVDIDNTLVDIKRFIKFAVWKKLPFPQELVDAFMKQSLQAPNCIDEESNSKAEANDITGSLDIKYPEYKGLKFDELTPGTFEDIKKYYGMLQREEAKSRKAIPIATNIGILFYEKGLSKPATKSEFMDAYNKEFSGVPKWVVEAIYEGLPDQYKSLSKPTVREEGCIDDDAVDVIIKAAVLAGYLACKEGIDVLSELEERLVEDEFEMPSGTYLKAITGACKKVIKIYN